MAGEAPAAVVVSNQPQRGRYEAVVADVLAGFLEYRVTGDAVVFTHAEVFPRWEGQGIGSELAKQSLDDVVATGRRITPLCPFVVDYIARHPSYLHHVDPEHRGDIGG